MKSPVYLSLSVLGISLLLCVTAASGTSTGDSPPGTILWQFQAGSVYAGPAVGLDGTVYVVGGNPYPKLYALAPDGAKKWERDLGPNLNGAPAVAADGTIYVGANKAFRAYDANGSLRWSYPFPDTHLFHATPAIANDRTIYVGTGHPDKSLYALRPDGSLKWKFVVRAADAEVYAPVIGGDGTIYFGSSFDGCYALHPDGTRRWYYPMQGYNISCAIGGEGTVYVVGSIFPNKLFAFTPDGIKKWEAQIGGDLSQGASPPVIGNDGTIFVRSDADLKIFAFNPDGSTKWAFASTAGSGGVSTSPTMDSEGNVYTGLGLRFYALSPTGAQLWSFANSGGFTAASLTPEGILYVGTAGGQVFAVRANAGLGQDPWPMFQRDLRRTGAAPFVGVVDSDRDGVPDAGDVCPDTPPGTVVNAQGCSIAQLCRCDSSWRSHSDYVRCVIERAWDFYRAGLINRGERNAIVAAAARSDCGRRRRSPEPVLIHFCPQTRDECQREGMRIIVTGNAAERCRIEVSNDLIHWTQMSGEALIGDEIALPFSSGKGAFYRAQVSP